MNTFREPIVLKDDSSLEDKLVALRSRNFVNSNDIHMLEIGIEGERQVQYHLMKSNIGMYIMRDINLAVDGLKCQVDFVVETKNKIYLVEVKADKDVDDPDVLAKKERAVSYCKLVSEWAGTNGLKEWDYVLIPASKISEGSTFKHLSEQFLCD